MKTDKVRPTYAIQETQDSLVITWQGKKGVKWVVIRSLVGILFLVLIFLNIERVYFEYQVFYRSGVAYTAILMQHVILWLCTVYLLIINSIYACDLLFDLEKIMIMKDTIRVEKSGFLSFHRHKHYSLLNYPFFQYTIVDYGSSCVSFSHLRKSRFIHSLYPQPMHWFCRGISSQDALAILTRIKKKFPDINVLMDYEPIVRPG